ncbi:MAG: DMT family transporter [Gammaproteobacteria bacterium]
MAFIYLIALLAVVIWGASPVATKVAVIDLPPLAVALLRTVVGGVVALGLALSFRLPLPDTKDKRLLLALSAGCGFIGFPVLFSVGVQLTSANHASIILAALPIFTAAIAFAWDRRWPRRLWWLGVAVAMIGESVLIAGKEPSSNQIASLSGDLVVLAGNVFASLGYVAGARLQQAGYPSTCTTFWGAGLAAVVLLPLAPFVMSDVAVSQVSVNAWLGVLYLSIGVTIIGYVMWYWALGKGGIARLGLVQFLQPVSGVILAGIVLGERVGPTLIVAAVLVLVGVWIALQVKG